MPKIAHLTEPTGWIDLSFVEGERAQGRFGVTPDMTTFAKAAGCGYQVAGFGGREEIMREIEPP
jgi:glutamate-1-semialdehyde aminotransferase